MFKTQAGHHLDRDIKACKRLKRESTGLGVRSHKILAKIIAVESELDL